MNLNTLSGRMPPGFLQEQLLNPLAQELADFFFRQDTPSFNILKALIDGRESFLVVVVPGCWFV